MLSFCRSLLSIFALVSVFFCASPWGAEKELSEKEPKKCDTLLVPENSSMELAQSPVEGTSFDEYSNTLYRALSQLPRATREAILILMYRDQEGPSQQIRTRLFEELLDKFRYTAKPERLRMRNQKVPSERANALAYEIKIRTIMRYFGSKSNLFATPEELVNTIADLYSKLEDDKERKVALGMLPPLSQFPPWGKEALVSAFEKLGYSKVRISWLLFRRLNKKGVRFFTRNREGKFSLIHKGHPPYFGDYLQIGGVRTFVEYIKRRITDGTNFSESKSLEKMLAEDSEELKKEESLKDSVDFQAEEKKTALADAISKLKTHKEHIEKAKVEAANAKTPEWLQNKENTAGTSTKPKQIELTPQERASFKAYFDGLMASNLERDWAVEALKHILISKGNMLLVGPGGTAKTSLIRQFLGNLQIAGSASYAEVQFSQESTSDEVKGPYDPRALLEEGKYSRRYDQGVFESNFVTFDEIDKARPKLHPTLFTFLADRLDAAGPKMVQANTQIVVGTANKFISQLYLSPNILPQEVQPFIDRFDYVVFVPGEMEWIKSSVQLADDIDFKEKLDMNVVEKVRSMMDSVEIPLRVKLMANLLFYEMRSKTVAHQKEAEEQYAVGIRQPVKPPAPYKSTKIYSPRTQRKLFDKALKAAVVVRALENPGTDLTANFDDLKALRYFLVMSGPTAESCQYFKKHALDPHEESQYKFVEFENASFDAILKKLIDGYTGTSFGELVSKLNAITAEIASLSEKASSDQLVQLSQKLELLATEATGMLNFPKRNHELKPEHIFSSEHSEELKKALDRASSAFALKIEPVLQRLSDEADAL